MSVWMLVPESMLHTSWIVASSEEDATSSFPLADDVTGGRCAQNAILSNQKLLDAIGSTNLGYLLDDFRVVVAAISTDD